MKAASAPQNPKRTELSMRSLGYIAAKFLAAPACLSVFARVMLQAIRLGKHDLKHLPAHVKAVLAGAWSGFKARAPVGRAVSNAYARDFVDFLNPWRYGGRRHHEKMAAFYAQRQELYSLDHAATIRLV